MSRYEFFIVLALVIPTLVISAVIQNDHSRPPTLNPGYLNHSYYLLPSTKPGASFQPYLIQNNTDEPWALSSDDLKQYGSLNLPHEPGINTSVFIRRDGSFSNILPSITVPPLAFPSLPFHEDIGPQQGDVGTVADSTVLVEAEPTEPPVKGAIDYVLLPLLFLGVAGPLFVVMYIVVASVEYKLPPNHQLKRTDGDNARHLQTHYMDMTSLFQNAQPVLSILSASLSRAMDSDQCKEKLACRMGAYAKYYKSYSLFNYVENFVSMFVPRRYAKSFAILSKSDGNEEVCVKYSCSFIT